MFFVHNVIAQQLKPNLNFKANWEEIVAFSVEPLRIGRCNLSVVLQKQMQRKHLVNI